MNNNNILRLNTRIKNLHIVENFLEKICDQYNINNAYFGHILFSVTELFEITANTSGEVSAEITISFTSDKTGLKFLFSLDDLFLDIAAAFKISEEFLIDNQDNEDLKDSYLAIRLLCDEVVLRNDVSGIELVFYISSINKTLTKKRQDALDSYFSSIFITENTNSSNS